MRANAACCSFFAENLLGERASRGPLMAGKVVCGSAGEAESVWLVAWVLLLCAC
jgi:hypothetical protein